MHQVNDRIYRGQARTLERRYRRLIISLVASSKLHLIAVFGPLLDLRIVPSLDQVVGNFRSNMANSPSPNKPRLKRKLDELRKIMNLQFLHDVAPVIIHGPNADENN